MSRSRSVATASLLMRYESAMGLESFSSTRAMLTGRFAGEDEEEDEEAPPAEGGAGELLLPPPAFATPAPTAV